MKTMRRAMVMAATVAMLAMVPTGAFADTYPPEVEPTEVVTDDATPPAETGVDADSVEPPAQDDTDVLPAPGVDPAEVDPEAEPVADAEVLSATGGDVLPMLGAAMALLLVGGVLATVSGRRRRTTASTSS